MPPEKFKWFSFAVEMKSQTEYTAVKTEEKGGDTQEVNYDKTKLLNIVLLGIVFMTTGSRFV